MEDTNQHGPDAAATLARGMQQHRAGALALAAASYAAVLEKEPRHAQALYLAGILAHQTGDTRRSASLIAAATREDPGNADAWFDLGQMLEVLGRTDEAVQAWEQVLRLRPGHEAAPPRLAAALTAAGRLDEAMAVYLALSERQPDRLEALILASDIARSVMDFARVPGIVARLAARLDTAEGLADWRPLSSLLYRDLFMPLPDGLWPRLARRTGEVLAAQATATPLPPAHPRAGDGRLRIGYASANFGDHPIGHVTLSLFAAHDRGCFEVHGFSRHDRTGEASGYARRHAQGFDHLHQIGHLPPQQQAALIRSLGIDILVEIDGHMDKRGLEALAWRPAPVQVFWLGHAGGLGTGGADYLIADGIVVPPGEEANYGECIVRLPEAYHCADRHPIAADPGLRSDWGLPEQGAVFCAFNNIEKITKTVFDAWMRILGRVDGSVLWLSTSETARVRMTNMRRLAEARGIDPARLICAGRIPDKTRHLARHALADLFLDTLSLNASTTALDALWAGLPVLTVAGERFSGRIAATMVTAMGLPDLVCPSLAAYEDRAVALAGDPAARAALRSRVASGRTGAPLFDIYRFTRHLEAAFTTMWAHHRAGREPRSFDVPPLPS